VLTPVILWRQLPCCAGAVLRYVADNTTTLEGAGDVCSMSAFDLPRHGSGRYCFGVPGAGAPRGARSRQGKVEKSLVSFAAAHFGWEPTDEEARRVSL
jgi:autophagy-related protein 9